MSFDLNGIPYRSMTTHTSDPSTHVVRLSSLFSFTYDALDEAHGSTFDEVSSTAEGPLIIGGVTRHLLCHLIAPDLSTLYLSWVAVNDLLAILRFFIQASNSQRCLHNLNIEYPPHEGDGRELVSLLSELHALANLTINFRAFRGSPKYHFDPLLSALCWPIQQSASPGPRASSNSSRDGAAKSSRICPSLQKLHFSCLWQLAPELLEELVRSRARSSLHEVRTAPPCFLTHVVLEKIGPDEDPRVNLQWLEDMKDMGLLDG